jgi:hypothetical protein
MPDVGTERLGDGPSEVVLDRLDQLGLAFGEKPLQGVELAGPPRERAGNAGSEGGAKPVEEFTEVGLDGRVGRVGHLCSFGATGDDRSRVKVPGQHAACPRGADKWVARHLRSAAVHFEEARRVLGLGEAWEDPARVRRAYLDAMRRVHPDVNHEPGAAEQAMALNVAYQLICAVIANQQSSRPAAVRQSRPASHAPAPARLVRLAADDTISMAVPAHEAFLVAHEASQSIGDVSYVDLDAGLLQVIVEFEGYPPCQLHLDLQGRAASGSTEVFVTIESATGAAAPPIGPVTVLVADAMAAAAASVTA